MGSHGFNAPHGQRRLRPARRGARQVHGNGARRAQPVHVLLHARGHLQPPAHRLSRPYSGTASATAPVGRAVLQRMRTADIRAFKSCYGEYCSPAWPLSTEEPVSHCTAPRARAGKARFRRGSTRWGAHHKAVHPCIARLANAIDSPQRLCLHCRVQQRLDQHHMLRLCAQHAWLSREGSGSCEQESQKSGS